MDNGSHELIPLGRLWSESFPVHGDDLDPIESERLSCFAYEDDLNIVK